MINSPASRCCAQSSGSGSDAGQTIQAFSNLLYSHCSNLAGQLKGLNVLHMKHHDYIEYSSQQMLANVVKKGKIKRENELGGLLSDRVLCAQV